MDYTFVTYSFCYLLITMKSYKFSFHYEKDPFSNDIKLKKFDQDISTKTFTLTFILFGFYFI